jgi:hypothetical protein
MDNIDIDIDIEEFRRWCKHQREIWEKQSYFLSFDNWKLLMLWKRVKHLEEDLTRSAAE